MTPTLQMPVERGEAKQIGGRLFRKQVLRTGEIRHKGQRLKFDRHYLASLVESFKGRAFDQVPLVLVNEKNEHVSDPEKFRGEVKGFELTDDGLDALVELTEEGADLVAKNPRLGVSARIVPDLTKSDGRTFPVAIEHVAATLNPVVSGLRGWAMETDSTESVRSLSQTSDTAVIDLSASEYMDTTATLTDEHLESLKGLTPEERTAKVHELLGENTNTSTEDKGSKFSLKGLFGIKDDKITDADLHDAITKLEAEDAAEVTTVDEKDKAVASLSDDDQRRIDLAEETARKADQRVAAAEWKTERLELANAGVPPAMLDLAEPVLKSGQKVTIDLSDDSKADAAEVIRNLLTAAKGTVDLSDAQGSEQDRTNEQEAKELASDDEAWRF